MHLILTQCWFLRYILICMNCLLICLFFIVSRCYLEPECSRSCKGRCNPLVCTAGWCYSCQRFAAISKIGRTILITLLSQRSDKVKLACAISLTMKGKRVYIDPVNQQIL